MIRKILLTCFVIFGLLFAGISPAPAKIFGGSEYLTNANSLRIKSRRFGPYATLRRANEVANYARSLGYNAKVIYGSVDYSRAYFVDVW